MTEAVERMAILTTHGPNMIGGRGGRDRFTAQDLEAAIAMAHMSEGAELLTRALGTQEFPAIRAWHAFWKDRVFRMAEAWAWGEERHRMVSFALITSVDVLDPGNCPHCNGAKVHHNQKECARCQGTGKREWSDPDMALRLGVSSPEWDTKWRARYKLAMHRLAIWLSDATSALNRTAH